jgi:hypothetical protein
MKPKLTPEELRQKQIDFMEKVKQLDKSPVQMNSNLGQEVVKDLPVEKIDTNQFQKVRSSDAMAETMAKVAERRAARAAGQGRSASSSIPGNALDYGQLRKEYAQKAKSEKAGKLAKAFAGKGKLGMAMGPIGALAGAALAGSADEAFANAVIPGGLEGVGAGSDMPMEDDTAQVEMAAQAATDPNMRRMALQELKNRSR